MLKTSKLPLLKQNLSGRDIEVKTLNRIVSILLVETIVLCSDALNKNFLSAKKTLVNIENESKIEYPSVIEE